MKKGSITIFSLLSLLLVTAAVFALLEGTRLQEMRRFADLQTMSALESVFANYSSYLWENYRLLGTDQTQMMDILEQSASGRIGSGNNLLELKAEEIQLESYTLLSDGNGVVFIKSVAAYMQENLVYELIKELYHQYETAKDIMDSSEMDKRNIDSALEEIDKTESEEKERSVGMAGETKEEVRNILQSAKEWKDMGILEMLLESTDELSDLNVKFENCLLERTLATGTGWEDSFITWSDEVLLQQYLLTYLSSFMDKKEDRALSYEIEYLIGKKNSDIENLKVVATRLLELREASNFLYLLSNPVKIAQAEMMAGYIAGASLNPLLIEVVKIGLLTAWAFAESILDVRALLAGKKVPLMKSEESWTMELENISELTQSFCMAKESAQGLGYENYLGMLLLLEEKKGLAMRTMNLQEATIRKCCQDDAFGMDSMIVHACARVRYSYSPVFPFLSVINAEDRWKYDIWSEDAYGYY